MKKIIAALSVTAFAIAGCANPMPDHPVEYATFEPRITNVAGSGSLTDLLLPPTAVVEPEITKGSLGVFLEDYVPESVLQGTLDTYLNHYVPEGE